MPSVVEVTKYGSFPFLTQILVSRPEKIFTTGYTTKSTGSGLGLVICKKSIEEMFGKLELEHNDEDYVEFVIRIAKVG